MVSFSYLSFTTSENVTLKSVALFCPPCTLVYCQELMSSFVLTSAGHIVLALSPKPSKFIRHLVKIAQVDSVA